MAVGARFRRTVPRIVPDFKSNSAGETERQHISSFSPCASVGCRYMQGIPTQRKESAPPASGLTYGPEVPNDLKSQPSRALHHVPLITLYERYAETLSSSELSIKSGVFCSSSMIFFTISGIPESGQDG